MKRKQIVIGTILSLILVGLSACERSGLEVPINPQSHALTKTSMLPPRPAPSVKKATIGLKEEETFVKKFLVAYTTYSSLNAQKAAIKPLLTSGLQKRLAVSQQSTPDLNQVTSAGQNLSVWHNDKNQWLGLVTVKINNQTSSVQVFVVGLEMQGKHTLVNRLSSPTQE